jgi:hypothetical protein
MDGMQSDEAGLISITVLSVTLARAGKRNRRVSGECRS